MSVWKIPIDKYGGVIRDPHRKTAVPGEWVAHWLPNDVTFVMSLRVDNYVKTSNNSHCICSNWEHKELRFPFSMPQFFDLVFQATLRQGRVPAAKYGVVKQGDVYSMQLIEMVSPHLHLAREDEDFAKWLSEVDRIMHRRPLDSYDYDYLREMYDEGDSPTCAVLEMNKSILED